MSQLFAPYHDHFVVRQQSINCPQLMHTEVSISLTFRTSVLKAELMQLTLTELHVVALN